MNRDVLYYKLAKQSLLDSEKDCAVEEIEKFLDSADYYGVVTRVNYSTTFIFEEFVFQITEAVGWEEGFHGKLLDAVEGLSDDVLVFEKAKNDIMCFQTTNDGKQAIAMALFRTMISVHERWMCDNQKDYYKKYLTNNEQYLFLPIELIGWDNAKKHLLDLDLMIKEFGIQYDERDVKDAYDQSLIRMLKRNGLIKDFISRCIRDSLLDNCFLNHMHESVYMQLTNHDFIKTTLMPQLKEKGFGQDKYIVLLMEEEGYFRFDIFC